MFQQRTTSNKRQTKTGLLVQVSACDISLLPDVTLYMYQPRTDGTTASANRYLMALNQTFSDQERRSTLHNAIAVLSMDLYLRLDPAFGALGSHREQALGALQAHAEGSATEHLEARDCSAGYCNSVVCSG